MFERISLLNQVMGVVPCVKGTRIPVASVVRMLAEGLSIDEVLADFPQLSEDDVREALRYAAAVVKGGDVPPRPVC